MESILKEERERSAAVCDRLETAEENLQEARDTIEMLKTDLAKHKGIADKGTDVFLVSAKLVLHLPSFSYMEILNI